MGVIHNMKNFEEFKKVIDEIESSRGYQLDLHAYRLENSFKIMVINYGYLEKITKAIPFFPKGKETEKEKVMIEASRCFVNFLCSAVAYKDHCRKMIRKLYGSDEAALNGEYAKKIKDEFLEDPLVGFIECLRNIYCHDELPPLGLESRMVDEEFVTKFVIFIDQLDKESGYYSKGEKFVQLQKESAVGVFQISHDYLHKTTFPWLMNAQLKHHKEEFAELEALRKKAKKLMDE